MLKMKRLNYLSCNKFILYTTIFAFLFGLYGYLYFPISAIHYHFFLSAPLATYLSASLLVRFAFKSDSKGIGGIVGISLFLTLMATYLNFVLLDLGYSFHCLMVGHETRYLDKPEFLFPFYMGIFKAFIMLYKSGGITFIVFTTIGFITLSEKKKTTISKENDTQ